MATILDRVSDWVLGDAQASLARVFEERASAIHLRLFVLSI